MQVWLRFVKLTADLGGPPLDAGSGFVAGFGVGSHGGAETLAVAPAVTRTGVSHARVKERTGVDLQHTTTMYWLVNELQTGAIKMLSLKLQQQGKS